MVASLPIWKRLHFSVGAYLTCNVPLRSGIYMESTSGQSYASLKKIVNDPVAVCRSFTRSQVRMRNVRSSSELKDSLLESQSSCFGLHPVSQSLPASSTSLLYLDSSLIHALISSCTAIEKFGSRSPRSGLTLFPEPPWSNW